MFHCARLVVCVFVLCLFFSCSPQKPAESGNKPVIAVTYSALGALVQELAAEQFQVQVVIPNGLDPHEWEASAQDIAKLSKAHLIVQNGLGLEGGIEKTLARIKASGVPFFTASEHITVRTVKAGQGLPGDDPDQAEGAPDPHLWLDPLQMKAVIHALAQEIKTRFQVDLSTRAAAVEAKLEALNERIASQAATLTPQQKRLVTGHESLGYFAERYGFTLVGALIPSLTTQAEVSASQLSDLKKVIARSQVKVVFTELGTPPKVAQALARDLKIQAVEMGTHALGPDGSYFSMMEKLSAAIIDNLRK